MAYSHSFKIERTNSWPLKKWWRVIPKLIYSYTMLWREQKTHIKKRHYKITLECREFVKYLGVLIDYKLSWNNHIDTILLKISRTVGLLSKLRHFVPFSTLISIYHSLIAPCLRYGLIAWGQASKSQLNKLLVLQKHALRFIHFAKLHDHAIPLFINTKILSINWFSIISY